VQHGRAAPAKAAWAHMAVALAEVVGLALAKQALGATARLAQPIPEKGPWPQLRRGVAQGWMTAVAPLRAMPQKLLH
jgi:hypothetical protein